MALCLAFAGAGLVSCSSDDDKGTVDDSKRIEGTYTLREVNTQEATDFDDDGDAHANQMEESECYDGGKITLNDDNTFSYVITGIIVDVEENTSGCAQSFTANGTYDVDPANDTDAVITLTYTNQGGETVTRELTKLGKELIWEDDNLLSTYPDRNNDGGYILRPGSTQYVFSK